MSLENTEAPAPEEKPAEFSSDMPGLRDAAAELASQDHEVSKVEVSEDAPAELTPREAGRELEKFHQKQAEEQNAVRKAMGVDVPEPTEQQRLESRVRELEASRQSGDTQEHYERGQQQLQEAQQQAHQLQQYRNQLAEGFQNEFGISTIQELQELATFAPERATEAVQYLQNAEQLVVQAQQAVVGQQTLAEQAISVWGNSEDSKFMDAHPELKNPKAREAAQKAAMEVLKESGLSDAEIYHHYTRSGLLRSAAAQSLVLQAARHHMGKKGAKNLRPKPLPKVFRPGVGGGKEIHGVQAATKRLSEFGSLKDAEITSTHSGRKVSSDEGSG